MADKKPRRPDVKKPGLTIKQRRAAKKLKHPTTGSSGTLDALHAPKTTGR
jgi:hypothetical protein